VAAEDLAVPDLGSPEDLSRTYDAGYPFVDAAGYCDNAVDIPDAGGGLAGTCAQAFFEKLVGCYVPSGPCVYDYPNSSRFRVCWQSGAALEEIGGISPRYYVNGTFLCMSMTRISAGHVEVWTAYDGTVLQYDKFSGDVTCPDGSHLNLGSEYGNCTALFNLVHEGRSANYFGCTPVSSYMNDVCPPTLNY
jgi:hypothetical protein